MDVGALSLLISESGFAATMQKVAQLDAAAARVGAKPAEIKVSAPTAAPVQASLTRIQQTASAIAGTPTTVRFSLAGVQQVTSALGGLDAAKQQAARPVVLTVTAPNVAPALGAFSALAEAQTLQSERARALSAVLTAIGTESTTAAQKVAVLRAALDQDSASTERLSAAARTLSIAEREGTEVLRLRTAATNELIAAQNELSRSQSTGARARAAPLAAGAGAPVAVGPQLGPATPEREDFARRAAATRAALEAENVALRANAQASEQATKATRQLGAAKEQAAQQSRALRAEIALAPRQLSQLAASADLSSKTQVDAIRRTIVEQRAWMQSVGASEQQMARFNAAVMRFEQRVASAGNAVQGMSPKVRSAANATAAMAFILASGGNDLQSFALAAGLAGSSLADAFGSNKMAMYASGIGAALVLVTSFVGVLERMTDAAAKARTANDAVVRSIQDIKGVVEAQSALKVAQQNLARATDELAAANKRVMQGGPSAFSIVPDIAAMRTAQKAVEHFREQVRAAEHQIEVNRIRETDEMAEARREIVVEGLAAEARARDAAQQAALAREATAFATGRSSLEKFFAARLALIEQSSAREIAVLRARQQTLTEPRPDAPPEDSARRAAEIQRLGVQIREIESRVREESATTIEQRRAQREALDKQILGFETREAEAHGDASKQRIEQAKIEAREIARVLVQRSGATTPEALAQAWADANAAEQKYVDTQTRVIGAQQQQQAAQRVFNDLEIARLEIQQLLARGTITEAEAQQRLAAEERKRIADLVKIAEAMERFGTELDNPDLIAAARRLRTEINGLANAPLGPLAARLKAIRDELSLAASEGDQAAADLLRRINERVKQSGGKVTIGVVLEAEWQRDIEAQIKQGLAMQEILLKPENIVLSGVEQAIQQLNQELGGLAMGVGNALGGALAAGFSSAFTKGSGKNFMEAAGNALLSGVGGLLVQMGSAMVAYAAIMAVAAPLLAATPFATWTLSAPAAAIAGTALIALGAGMGAIAANNTGSRTGGGGSGSSGQAGQREIAPRRVLLDPDRHLRERRELGITARGGEGLRAIAPPAPVVNNFTFLGSPNPQIERFIAKASVGADGRSIPITRRRR